MITDPCMNAGHEICIDCGVCRTCAHAHTKVCPQHPDRILYQQERDAARARGNTHLLKPKQKDGDEQPKTEMTDSQLADAKQIFDRQSEERKAARKRSMQHYPSRDPLNL